MEKIKNQNSSEALKITVPFYEKTAKFSFIDLSKTFFQSWEIAG